MKMTKTEQIVNEILNNKGNDFRKLKPSLFVTKMYDEYLKNYVGNNTLNGSIFEEIILRCLLLNGISPIYTQVKMSFVPNVIFDIVIYNRQAPVILSIKTSLRERWKQADLEAVALKYVYKNASAYLLNNSPKENETRKKDLYGYIGLNNFIYVGSEEFDNLVERIKNAEIQSFECIPVFTSYKEHIN